MKKQITFLLCSVLTLSVSSQKQNITLNNIWTQYKFHAEGIDELRSTSDGERYTTLSMAGGGQAVIAYNYATGKVADTLLTANQLEKAGNKIMIADYALGKDEKNILLST